MGIKDLWSILTPFCERRPLYELQGKNVAIDLSCWICEAQNIAEYQIQPRMYLRNLYFRTCCLLLMDVNPIFVLEGKAPTLKYDTIAARNAVQFKGAAPKKDGVKTSKDRTRFHFTLKQCEQMLQYMGLACITGQGEAEAMCAYLNEDGMVAGCISQDSDCFAYGAKVVYRNFSISQQGAHSATGGSIDVYDIRRAYEAIDFGRNKVVALALISGSDYSDGIMGIGKDSALKLFDKISDEQILDRLRSWRSNHSLYDEFFKKISDKNLCTSCGHSGKLQSHTKAGCLECKTTKGCDFTKFKDERLDIKNELNMRSKAMMDSNFPNEDLIREFLVRKDNVSKLNLDWKKPDMVNFVKFTTKYLQWEEIYAFEKLLPILTRWLVRNHKIKSPDRKSKPVISPDYIKKVRAPKGVPSYEIIWKDEDGNYNSLIPDDQLKNTDPIKLWSTIEPQNLVKEAYPELVEAYEQSKIKPKKPSKRKQKQITLDELGEKLQNTSITEPLPKKKVASSKTKKKEKENGQESTKGREKRKKDVFEDLECSMEGLCIKENKATSKLKTIDSYFKKAVINNIEKKGSKEITNNCLVDQKILPSNVTKTTTISCSSLNGSFDFDISKFGDEEDLDLSDVIDNIVKKDPLTEIKEKLEELRNRLDAISNSPKKNLNMSFNVHENNLKLTSEKFEKFIEEEGTIKPGNRSSFFVKNFEEDCDLFEKTFNEQCAISDSEDTEEFSEDTEGLGEDNHKEPTGDDLDEDSFIQNYVPLIERIKK